MKGSSKFARPLFIAAWFLAIGSVPDYGGLRPAAQPFQESIGISADGLGVSASSTGLIQAEIPLISPTTLAVANRAITKESRLDNRSR